MTEETAIASVGPEAAVPVNSMPTRPCGEKEVTAVARAIMGIADSHARDRKLSAGEVSTYLSGTAFQEFAKWILATRTNDKGVRTTKFVQFARGDGSLEADELAAPVRDFFGDHLVDGGMEGGAVQCGGMVAQMIDAAEAWIIEAERRRAEARKRREEADRYRSGQRKTKVRDVKIMAEALMWIADTPPRNGEVSGSELLTNLRGTPYEIFSKWITSSGKMRKYDKDGGGSIGIEEIQRAVAEYLGKEMTAIGEGQVVAAHQWFAAREHRRAERRVLRDADHDEREGLARVAADLSPNRAVAAVKIQSVFRSHNSRMHQMETLHDEILGEPQRPSSALSGRVTLARLWPESLPGVRCLCFAATSTLAELLFPAVGPKSSHGIEAIQAFLAARVRKFGSQHPETHLYAEQLMLACNAIGGLHVLSGDVPIASRFFETADQTECETPPDFLAAAELRAMTNGNLSYAAVCRGDTTDALAYAQREREAYEAGGFRCGVVAADIHIAYALSLQGEHESSRDLLREVLDELKKWGDSVRAETKTMLGTETRGLLQVYLPRTCVEAVCMYSYVVELIACKAYGEAVRHACEALELMLEVFDTTKTAGVLPMFEHLFKVAAGCHEGAIDDVELHAHHDMDVAPRCMHHLQSLKYAHSELSAEERTALGAPRAEDGAPGNTSPVRRNSKRRLLGVYRPSSTYDDDAWSGGAVAHAVQAVWWNTIR